MGPNTLFHLLGIGASPGPGDSNAPILSYLIQQRRHSISQKFDRLSDGDRQEAELERLLVEPVHPLLFCTALALSKVRCQDYRGIVQDYMSGNVIDWLESHLLRIDARVREDEMSGVLEAERQLLNDAMVLAVDWLVPARNGSTTAFARLIEDLRRGTASDEAPTLHHIRWAVWLELNPAMSIVPLPGDTRASILKRYGRKNNSAFHNAEAYFARHLDSQKRRINETVRPRVSGEEKKRLAAKQYGAYNVATQLLERARDFYWWNPDEIAVYMLTSRAFFSEGPEGGSS
jgi:hypothetical protein